MMFITSKIAGSSGKFFIKQQKDLGDVNGYIEEMINGQKVIKVFCHEEKSKEEFDKRLEEKKQNSIKLLDSFTQVNKENRHVLAEAYQKLAKSFNYKDDYVAVNTHGGGDLIPTFNNLVMINDMRSYEIQQIDYKDRFRVFSALGEQIQGVDLVKKILLEIDNLKQFSDKMKFLYSLHMDEEIAKQVLDNIYDTRFAKYYWTISASRAGSLNYQSGKLEEEYQAITNPEDTSILDTKLKNRIISTFSLNARYSKADVKEILKKIYSDLKYDKTPKANDLEKYFEIKECKVLNSDTGKRDAGFEIIKKKED